MEAEINILHVGYCFKKPDLNTMEDCCTCTLIRTPKNTIIVDTMNPWDGPFIKSKLDELGVKKIDYVISTHGHTDHIGNNNMFLEAKHIVGFCISHKSEYWLHPFQQGEEFKIDEWVTVFPTPGHTSEDVSVRMKASTGKTVILSGDIFECEQDFELIDKWMSFSFCPKLQAEQRLKILKQADFVIPGHGPMFEVHQNHIRAAEEMCVNLANGSILP